MVSVYLPKAADEQIFSCHSPFNDTYSKRNIFRNTAPAHLLPICSYFTAVVVEVKGM